MLDKFEVRKGSNTGSYSSFNAMWSSFVREWKGLSQGQNLGELARKGAFIVEKLSCRLSISIH